MKTEIHFASVKDRVQIADVIGKHVTLSARGKDLWGCCPFHQEKTASFHIRASDDRYHCFGCGAEGDVLDFMQKIGGYSLMEAVENLVGPVSVPPSPESMLRDTRRLRDDRRKKRRSSLSDKILADLVKARGRLAEARRILSSMGSAATEEQINEAVRAEERVQFYEYSWDSRSG